MTGSTQPRPRARPDRVRLPERLAFPATIVAFLAIVSQTAVPSPLYPIYEARFRLEPIQITIVFAAYVVGIVTALVTVGSLSDFVGRRPSIFASAALIVAADVVFLDARGFTSLVLARVLQGLGIGVGNAALAAALSDFVPRGNARIAAILAGALPPTSLCLGALWGGIAVQLLAKPDTVAYSVCVAAGAMAAGIVVLLPERQPRRSGAWASLRPDLSIPASTRPAFRAVAGSLVAGWALIGLYLALMPSVLMMAWPHASPVERVLPICGALAAAGLAGLVLVHVGERRAMRISLGALIAGSAIVASAVFVPGVPVVLLAPGTAVAGFGIGGTFQSALRHVIVATSPQHRAAVMAAALTVSFVAFGLPSVIAGALVPLAGVASVAGAYACVMIVLSVITTIGYARYRPDASP